MQYLIRPETVLFAGLPSRHSSMNYLHHIGFAAGAKTALTFFSLVVCHHNGTIESKSFWKVDHTLLSLTIDICISQHSGTTA